MRAEKEKEKKGQYTNRTVRNASSSRRNTLLSRLVICKVHAVIFLDSSCHIEKKLGQGAINAAIALAVQQREVGGHAVVSFCRHTAQKRCVGVYV